MANLMNMANLANLAAINPQYLAVNEVNMILFFTFKTYVNVLFFFIKKFL